MEILTKEDLQILRFQLLDDLKKMISRSEEKKEKLEWLKSREVRELLKVSPGTLQNLRVSGKLNPVKIRGMWYYKLSEVNSLFKNQDGYGRHGI